jgi:fucose 4-O-acetylase-like acetyltransferase
MEKNKENLLSNIVLIRTFAILIVVLGHSMIVYSNNWPIFEPKIQCNFFNSVKKYIDVFQMPLFIFVSGYIYHFVKVEKKKYPDFLPFLNNKFKRLIIPYLCIAIFYVLPIRLLIHYAPYQGEGLGTLLFGNVLLSKDIGHLWYLPTLFFIFILFYLLENLFSKIPWLINIVILTGISCISVLFPNILNISNVAQYLLFFYLGYIIRPYHNTIQY